MKKDLEKNIHLQDAVIKRKGPEFISMGNFITYIIKLIQFITPFKSGKKYLKKYPIEEEYEPKKTFWGWYQCKEIGNMPDPIDKEGRELL
jgi:hypothetical protein